MIGTVVGERCAVAGDRHRSLVDPHGSVNKAQVVIAIRPAGRYRIGAGVLFGTRCAHAGEHSSRLAADQAAGAKATDRLVVAVIGHSAAVGGDHGIGLVDDHGPVNKEQVVIGSRSAGRHRIGTGVLFGA